jgi:hypothetical protein
MVIERWTVFLNGWQGCKQKRPLYCNILQHRRYMYYYASINSVGACISVSQEEKDRDAYFLVS